MKAIPARNFARPAHGFSLVEVLMVVAIIAVMAGIAAPRYSGALARYRADVTARRIASDLELAQSRAYSRSQTQSVVFSVPSNSYQVVGMMDPIRPSQTYAVLLADHPYNARLESISFSNGSIAFDAFGQPLTTGNVVISVGAERRTITLNPSSGRAQVQ